MARYSVFLTPSHTDFDYTVALIGKLCARYGGVPFEPHVTVYSGEFSDPDILVKAVSTAVSDIGPFSLPVRRIGWGESYFRSLYVEFGENPELREIHERIRNGVESDSGYVLFPHLSLHYGDQPQSDREAAAKGLVLDRTVIQFDRMKIVTPRNREEGWRDTAQWQTIFRIGLMMSP
jgi:putative hydrolase of the HAD superfamily